MDKLFVIGLIGVIWIVLWRLPELCRLYNEHRKHK